MKVYLNGIAQSRLQRSSVRPGCRRDPAATRQQQDREANITSAVRDFLVWSPSWSGPRIWSRRTRPHTALAQALWISPPWDTLIEFKRCASERPQAMHPNPQFVRAARRLPGPIGTGRVGCEWAVLTDGKHWLLRWPNAGAGRRRTPPHAFTFDDADRWLALYEWLRDHALFAEENVDPTQDPRSKSTSDRRLHPTSGT